MQINDGINGEANVEDDNHEDTNEVGLVKASKFKFVVDLFSFSFYFYFYIYTLRKTLYNNNVNCEVDKFFFFRELQFMASVHDDSFLSL